MTKQTYKSWSMADHAELVLMREARVPTKEIARALKRTPSSVVNHIYQHGIPYGKEPTFRDVVDTAFAKHKIEFGEPEERAFEELKERDERARVYLARRPSKPQWYKAMMWWRK
tara:strand:+ start:204 stop:545 length:342 start_codon:yes stop_codon:yes gene_type:complete